uniref:Uncharacterized protein n=1 Tax=Branchiostoma floridae TaxID=7739 RepID=C3YWW2_BRAFL|eukprot:XP_002599344.1 hypothetical protein BRAFLDRAFT_64303 [Branchiostoma floridae]
MREPFAIKNFTAKDAGVYTCVVDKGSFKKKYEVMFCMIPKPQNDKKHQPNLENAPVKNNTIISVTSPNQSLIPSGSPDQKFSGPNSAYILPITVANILVAMLLAAVFFLMKKRATRNTAGAAVQVGLEAMAARNPVNAMVDVVEEEENTDANLPQSLPRDETQSATATEATGTCQCVTETDTTHTTEADIHVYSNDDTSADSDEDEEAPHHQYASAAPPPVPDIDDDDGNPGQETAGYSTTEMVQEEHSTSQNESGDEDKPYGIAAANVVYQATAVHQSLSHGNPTICETPSYDTPTCIAVQESLSHGNPTDVCESLSYDTPTVAQQSMSYGNPTCTAVQQTLSYSNPNAVQQSLSYVNPTAVQQSMSYDAYDVL